MVGHRSAAQWGRREAVLGQLSPSLSIQVPRCSSISNCSSLPCVPDKNPAPRHNPRGTSRALLGPALVKGPDRPLGGHGQGNFARVNLLTEDHTHERGPPDLL